MSTGEIGSTKVNVHDALKIGEDMLMEFEKCWPDGFYSPISKKVTTMTVSPKSIPVSDTETFDLNAIYSRVIALLSSSRDLDVRDVF